MTIKEIANLAGVSISTVSKIVNGKDQNMNQQTRERVLKIVKEYNYTPYGTVRNLTQAKSFVLGVLLRSSRQTNLMLNGILQAAQEAGYNILLLDSHGDSSIELKHITALCRHRVDGVIWEPVSTNSLQHEHFFTEQNIQICPLNPPANGTGYTIDFTQMGYHLTEKLIQYKHSQLVCLTKKGSLRSSMVLNGFKKCLYDYQIAYHDKMQVTIDDPACCSKIITHNFSGIVSSHFASALNLYEQMSKLHYYIPTDFSMVSLKDDVREAISFPRISSIKIPYLEFGYYVCTRLIRQCENIEDQQEPSWLFASNNEFDSEDSVEIPLFFRSKKIVVVGSINTDYTFNVDWLPQAGKTTTILSSTSTLGGKGANQSVGAAKLGRDVSLIGEIGNDIESPFIFDILEKEHVSTRGIHRDMGAQTGKAYIYIEKDGEGTITILSGANGNLSPKSVQNRQYLFENAGFALISTEIPIDTVLEAARTGRNYGAQIILKPATLKSLPKELWKLTDIFIPNRKEATALAPKDSTVEEQADYFFRQGVPIVIITLGHEGCFLKTATTQKYFPAANFVSIDTTGGADAFISALAAYLTEGYDLEKSIRIATYAAGICVSRQGVVPALTDRNTLETHIKKMEPDLLKK